MSDKKISELTTATTINPDDVSVLVNSGTDYKFAFSTLLQFLGNSLTVGANITFGTTLPQNTVGKNGDVFINTNTGSFAQKISGTWSIVYTLPSASSQTDGTVLYGLGIPGTLTGNNNDTYINTGTGVFYQKASGTWGQVFSMQTGPQGPQGTAGANGTNGTNGFSVLNGVINPSNLSTGVNGDFYINTGNYTLFGPKTAGVWGTGTSLVGAGVEAGGTAGQVLSKNSNADYDIVWVNPTSNTDSVTELPGAANKYFTENRVLATILAGLSFLTNTAVAATDTVLVAMGKLQAQFNSLSSAFQNKENQRLSTTDDVTHNNLTSTGIFSAGRVNVGAGLPSWLWGNTVGRFLIAWNRSNSEGETVFAANGGTSPLAVGGYVFVHVNNSGGETQLLKLSGNDFGAIFAGRISPGIIDAYGSPATVYLTYDPTTKALVSRTIAQVASDIGSSSGSGTKATSTELNTGTDDVKFATALGLENSKYITQSGAKISATASGTNVYSATISPAITAYTNTQRFYIRFTNANTSLSCTLSLNGLSDLPLVKGINTPLAVGDIVADSIHLVVLDGTNARILSLSAIPTVTSGEKVLTITSGGPQKNYDLQDLTAPSTPLTSADFSTGIATTTGLIGQVSYDSNYRYDCIGINQWRRSALNGNLIDLYLADIDDSAGDKTSEDLQTAYPSSLVGQQVWGINKLYIKKTTIGWKKITITTA